MGIERGAPGPQVWWTRMFSLVLAFQHLRHFFLFAHSISFLPTTLLRAMSGSGSSLCRLSSETLRIFGKGPHEHEEGGHWGSVSSSSRRGFVAKTTVQSFDSTLALRLARCPVHCGQLVVSCRRISVHGKKATYRGGWTIRRNRACVHPEH